MKKLIFIPILFLSFLLFSQSTDTLSLEEKIELFVKNGDYVKYTETNYTISYIFKSGIVRIDTPLDPDFYVLKIKTSDKYADENFYLDIEEYEEYYNETTVELDENYNLIITKSQHTKN